MRMCVKDRLIVSMLCMYGCARARLPWAAVRGRRYSAGNVRVYGSVTVVARVSNGNRVRRPGGNQHMLVARSTREYVIRVRVLTYPPPRVAVPPVQHTAAGAPPRCPGGDASRASLE